MKKIVFILTVLMLLSMTSVLAYAENHHGSYGRGHNRGQHCSGRYAWHRATDNYDAHYSNQCAEYEHFAHHRATHTYEAHYSNQCAEYGHSVWHRATNDYEGHYNHQCAEYHHTQ
ncbi:MAG: hypothetical protein LBI27_04040 [Clostridiales bacterium]|nr:hypothetical protein [Clostridiales bacterium]